MLLESVSPETVTQANVSVAFDNSPLDTSTVTGVTEAAEISVFKLIFNVGPIELSMKFRCALAPFGLINVTLSLMQSPSRSSPSDVEVSLASV